MTAVPASAASGTWTPYNWYTNVGATGTYTKDSRMVTVRGTVSDYRRDGYTACVRFLFTEPGTTGVYSTFRIVTSSGGNFDGSGKASIKMSSSRTGHLYVQECRLKAGKYSYGKGKRIY
ncbi:hypothetical protein [Actinomadura alba]|nr:hypothetical protein [Actinomadura alba]